MNIFTKDNYFTMEKEPELKMMTYGYYEVTFYGGDTEITMGASEEELKAEYHDQYGKDMIKSIVKVDASEFAKSLNADTSLAYSRIEKLLGGEAIDELDESVKSLIRRKLTNRANYKAAHQEVKAGKNVLDAARKYHKVDAKELQKMGEASKDDEEKFHQSLDKLVHDTFGNSETEKKKKTVKEEEGLEEKRGLWDNIHAKRERIKNGSGEKMRKPGSKGAPSNKDLKDSQTEDTEIDEKKGPCWTGYKKVPGKKDLTPGSCVKEVTESTSNSKLMYLSRIGLMDKNEVLLLKRALEVKNSGAPISAKNRNLLFKLLDKMIAMVINNPHMFNRAKRAAMQEAIDLFDDRELAMRLVEANLVDENWASKAMAGKSPLKKKYQAPKDDEEDRTKRLKKKQYGNMMGGLKEAGFMDPPTTKKEMDKKYPDVETDVKNKDSLEVQSVKAESKLKAAKLALEHFDSKHPVEVPLTFSEQKRYEQLLYAYETAADLVEIKVPAGKDAKSPVWTHTKAADAHKTAARQHVDDNHPARKAHMAAATAHQAAMKAHNKGSSDAASLTAKAHAASEKAKATNQNEQFNEGTYDTLTRAESGVHAKGREHNIQHKAGRYAAISDKHSDYDTSKASPQGKKEFKAAHDHYVKSKAAHADHKASNPKPPKKPTPQSDRSKESAGRYTGGKNKYTGD